MLLTELQAISADYIDQMCMENWPESDSLEFKRELPPSTDDGRIELCKDVCAFANAEGGDIVFGVAEAAGCASKVFPLTSNIDSEIRRVSQTLDALVEPRLGGLQFKRVEVEGGVVVVLRVPNSFAGPHSIRVKAMNSRKFVARTAAGVNEMSYEQIRLAFERTSTLASRAEEFIEKRRGALTAQGPQLRLESGPLLVVHGVPLASIAGKLSVSIPDLHAKYVQQGRALWTSIGRHFNVDGLCITGEYGRETWQGYVQIYRNGITEYVEFTPSYPNQFGTSCIPGPHISAVLHNGLEKAIESARQWGASGPLVLGVSLLNVRGFLFDVPRTHRFSDFKVTQEHILLPPAWVNSIQEVSNLEEHIRPLMDIVWQSFDFVKCKHYDPQGTWVEPH